VVDDCSQCIPPAKDEEDSVAYYFEISCAPISCEPSPAPSPPIFPTLNSFGLPSIVNDALEESDCLDGVVLVSKDTGGNAICEYFFSPITVEEHDESGSNEVRFSFSNQWQAESAEFKLFYDRGDGLGQQCQGLNSLAKGAIYPNTLAAACDPVSKTADVDVHLISGSVSHSSVMGQCGDDAVGSCSFVFKIPCSTDVVCDDSRRLDSQIEAGFEMSENMFIEQGFMTKEMKAAAELSDEFEDAPFCINKDYPCKGEEEKMVYVCHYSSIAGYQTFCIPEMDSDILRFNKNHHCGPCDGWNGQTEVTD